MKKTLAIIKNLKKYKKKQPNSKSFMMQQS